MLSYTKTAYRRTEIVEAGLFNPRDFTQELAYIHEDPLYIAGDLNSSTFNTPIE
jgi:hypothetical protein